MLQVFTAEQEIAVPETQNSARPAPLCSAAIAVCRARHQNTLQSHFSDGMLVSRDPASIGRSGNSRASERPDARSAQGAFLFSYHCARGVPMTVGSLHEAATDE